MSDFGFTVMIEQSITVGNIIEIITIAAGGFSVFITLRNTVSNLTNQVDSMQTEIKELAKVIVQLATTDLRLARLEEDFRDLRKGNGWILPKNEHPSS